MPTYGYVCSACGGFEASRPLAEAAEPCDCPDCDLPAPRGLAAPHLRNSWAGVRYLAEARNEKSAHEPMIEHRLKPVGEPPRKPQIHHGHASPGRPWMIGH